MDTKIKGLHEVEISAEELFAFHCTKYGKCCRDLGNILLTPKDMYDMAKELGLSMADFFERNCETFLRNEDEFFVEWHGFISRLNGFFCDLGKNTRTDMITLGQVLAFVGVYLSYDVGREFMPRFRKNTEETMRTLQEGLYGKCRGEDGLLRAIRNRFRVPSVLACN